MDNDAVNVAMQLELEEKIRQKVLDIIRNNSHTVAKDVAFHLWSDDTFIREVARRVGSKMCSVY